MMKSSYRHEVRKKYERSDVYEEPSSPETESAPAVPGWQNLQELNSRFARYINRARVLEQRNAVFRKQLETLQRMEETPGVEQTFSEQISVNRQRIRELRSDRAKLERELKDAERMLDEYNSRYRNECEYQEQLRHTLEQLSKGADTVLLKNLEYQIQLQFLQDDVNATRERHKKNLAEIQTYMNILQQINQTIPLMPGSSVSEDQERVMAQRRVPGLRTQLEEYKSAICQLKAQKQQLHTETSVLEQTIKTTQASYDGEIQQFNDRIESLRKEIEEAERSLEGYTSQCWRLAMYQSSLENELERSRRIIENEDSRLNSSIIGTPITLLTSRNEYTHSPSVSRQGRDITQAIQVITNVKPRQKNLPKKVFKMKEITSKQASGLEKAAGEFVEEEKEQVMEEQGERREEHAPGEDVPDGAQISKAFDTLCNIIRDRMRRGRRPEPIADFFTKGRYVLVTGDSSYLDPGFCSTTPSASHVFVTIHDDRMPYDPHWRGEPSPTPSPLPGPTPLYPSTPSDPGKGKGDGDERGKSKNGEPHPKEKEPEPSPSPPPGPHDKKDPSPPPPPGPRQPSPHRGGKPKIPEDPSIFPPMPSHTSIPPDSMSYEKLEVIESVEKLSPDKRVKGYEETTTVVETMIEKTSRKKHADKSS
ncbi:filensin [Rhinichthys klamathensis goyatoka]|uniref:filensin n=1 Tax=Rhinichthys klamathensis goyatoka TaxID=3034132 RepID=UPI0024B5FC68|nr:filensin [Rhinichthys klamathensis goyatoka]